MLFRSTIVDLSDISDNIVDKHSTGGVGDKCTLIIGPIVSSLGVCFAKLSGKGLGHTGGTIDKLDSINGFKTDLDNDDFREQLREIGIAVSSQTGKIAPADKKLYAIRDVTSTIDSIPLIAASIMSKKIASGAGNILLDVKCGSGAFMHSEEDASRLAEMMIRIGRESNRKIAAYITDMDQPLGNKIGNSLEIEEVCDTLLGRGPDDLNRLCIGLSAGMMKMTGYIPSEDLDSDIRAVLLNGKAYNKFKEFVTRQGGQFGIDGYPVFVSSTKFCTNVIAEKDGFITELDARAVGQAALELGAGRRTKEDVPDYCAGIILKKKTGDLVFRGEKIGRAS